MASGFTPPDLRKTLSVRVRTSLHTKLGAVRDLWQAKALASGLDQELVEAIDITYVVERLMLKVVDEELQQFGGYAETPEAREAQLAAVRVPLKKSR